MTEEKYTSLIIKTSLKTILFVFGFLCLILSYIFAISPMTMANVYSKFSMGNAEIASYESVYQATGKNADLYNLVQKCLEKEKYDKANSYIKELLTKKDFNSFAAAVNEASVEKATKEEVAFVVDLESYLLSQLLITDYRMGNKELAKQRAIQNLDDLENRYAFLFGIYYDEVLTDLSLTIAQAQNKLLQIYNTDGIKEKIDAKIALCDYESETNEKIKIATLYTKIKIMNYKRNIMGFARIDTTAINAEIDNLKEIYNALV